MARKQAPGADDKRRARLERQVSDIVNEIVLATADEDLEVAVDRLHARVQRVHGVDFDRAWAHRVVTTMRRGEVFRLVIR